MNYNTISLNERIKDEKGYFIGYYGLVKKENKYYDIMGGKRYCIGSAKIDDSKEDILTIEINIGNEVREYEKIKFIKAFIQTIKIYYPRKELISLTINGEKNVISNEETKETIEKILREKKNTEKELSKWNVSWTEEFDKADMHSYTYDEFTDRELFGQIESSEETMPEVFIKNKAIIWNIETNNCFRRITFDRDGFISLYKFRGSSDSSYNMTYDLKGNELTIQKYNDDTIMIKDNLINIDKNSENEKFSLTHLNNSKKIALTRQINRESSILLEIIEDSKGNIKKGNVDFRTHKGNKKINGVYALRIKKGQNPISLKSINRHGHQTQDFSELLNIKSDVLNEIENGNISDETIEGIIMIAVPVINMISLKIKRKQIPDNRDLVDIDKLREREFVSLNYIKQIKGEIPITKMRRIIEEAGKSYQKSKEKTKKR